MLMHLVWDTSGSMAGWGKPLIVRGVARAIEQYLRLGYGIADLRLVAWSDEARVLDWNSDHEFPSELLVPKGTASARELVAYFTTAPSGKILLLTDGFWSHATATELRRWKQGLLPDTLRVIRIGADANPQLTGVGVFTAEDWFAALDGWLPGGEA